MSLSAVDLNYLRIAEAVADSSKALNRKIGGVLVRNHTIISTGYNGPPRGLDEINTLFHYPNQVVKDIYLNFILKLLCCSKLINEEVTTNTKFLERIHSSLDKFITSITSDGKTELHPAITFTNITDKLLDILINSGVIKSATPESKLRQQIEMAMKAEGIQDPRYYLTSNCSTTYISKHGVDLKYQLDVHAELNCIINAARSGVSTIGSTLYITSGTPCKDCARSIANAGIVRVVCNGELETSDNDYNYLMSVEVLKRVGIEVEYRKSENA